MNKSRGITLIALVVTVVVLLIISAISIGMLTDENGIINQAKKGKEDTDIGKEKEIVTETSTLAANENEYGDIEQDILQDFLDDKIGENKATVSKVGKTIFVTFNETKRTYLINDNGQVFEQAESENGQKVLENAVILTNFSEKANIDKKLVEKIIFTDSKDGPSGVEIYDISEEQNDTVRMWVLDEDENEKYELYIGANYRVIANKDMSNFFNGFINCVSIGGLEYLDTSQTTTMNKMFYGCQNLENLDVSNFNTSNVTDMSNLFVNCYKIKRLDVSKWNTSNVTKMLDMFRDMVALEEIDVSNFDTRKVTTISGMFQDCLGLSKLDLSNFDTSNVTDMSRLFSFSRNLIEINISSFDFSQVTSYNLMFNTVPTKTKIYVNNQSDIDWIINNPKNSASIDFLL